MEIGGQRVLVVGMATSGIAAALFLRQRGARVVVSELRSAGELREEIPRLLAAGVAIETGGHRERSFLDADLIVVSPGVPADLPLLQRARAERIPVWGEIELA
ncbi:MAG: UDP-N-acetylmuramoyl-L-alanine--D-glutamate ligase, partial [Terriglobales bacterium]